MNITIAVAYHKISPIISGKYITPIHVGKDLVGIDLPGIAGDNSGNHISSKNASYCELTAVYWLWKNIQSDYYGLFHYRRFFNLKSTNSARIFQINSHTKNLFGLDEASIAAACSDYDIMLPAPYQCNELSVREQYAQCHNEHDIATCETIIRTNYPDYIQDMERTFADNRGYFFNMFIMRGDIFHEYAAWLFDILTEAEKRITVSDDPYQRRVFGFLAERLSGVFVEHKRRTSSLRIRECPLVIGDFDATFFKRLRHWRKNNFSVRLGKGRCSATLFGKRVL